MTRKLFTIHIRQKINKLNVKNLYINIYIYIYLKRKKAQTSKDNAVKKKNNSHKRKYKWHINLQEKYNLPSHQRV